MLRNYSFVFSGSNITCNDTFMECESRFMMNVSLMIIKICFPVIIVAGLFGNTMIVIIQRRLNDTQERSLSLLFTAMAVSDTVSLMTYPVFSVLEAYDITLNFSLDPIYKIRIWLLFWISWVSPWLLVAMTIQRAASIVWPHKVRFLFSRRTARTYVVIIVLLFASCNSHILYGHTLRDREDEKVVIVSYYFVSDDYRYFFDAIWSRLDLSMVVLLPFVLLFASNAILIKTLHRSARDLQAHFGTGNSGVFRTRGKRISSMTVRLICLSVAYLLLTSPVCAFFISQEFVSYDVASEGTVVAEDHFIFAVSVLLWYTNFSCNFYVYCLSGRKYRQECVQVLLCGIRKKAITTSVIMTGKGNDCLAVTAHEERQV